MDKKIKQIKKTNAKEGKQLKSLMKMDHKNDKLIDKAKKLKSKCK